jgi:cytochrome c-type biogenesis protein CcmE
MTPRQQRMVFVALIVVAAVGATMFAVRAFQLNKMYSIMPADLLAESTTVGKTFRLEGLVKQGSVQRAPGSLDVRFVVTDFKADVPVTYTGVLPDLFNEGQVAVSRGKYVDGVLVADEVLAKHDEKYMPPEVAEKLKKNNGGVLPSNLSHPGSQSAAQSSAPANTTSAQ